MAADDKDYRLAQDEVIKVCKILLHFHNSTQVRISEACESLSKEFNDELRNQDSAHRSQLDEIGQLLHNVHADHETFVQKCQQDLSELNLKVVKMQEVAHKCLDSLEEGTDAASKTGTILTCLVEFSNISQALQQQDGLDNRCLLQHTVTALSRMRPNDKISKRLSTESKAGLEDSIITQQQSQGALSPRGSMSKDVVGSASLE